MIEQIEPTKRPTKVTPVDDMILSFDVVSLTSIGLAHFCRAPPISQQIKTIGVYPQIDRFTLCANV